MSENNRNQELTPEEQKQLITMLRTRFMKNPERHKGIEWELVQHRLEAEPVKLWSLYEMERTGGEPDVVGHDKATGQIVFYDCSAETPKDRRNLCYDREALDARKEFKPGSSATDMASAMGIGLLTEDEYIYLQRLGDFDTKTSSWLQTPRISGNLEGRSSVTAVSAAFLSIITEHPHIIPSGDSADH